MRREDKKNEINIYYAMLYRLLIAMIAFQVCRLMFYFFNMELFPNTTIGSLPSLMAGGLVFDLTAMLYVNSLFIVMQVIPIPFTSRRGYQKVSSFVYMLTNSIAIGANMIDIIYYRFTLRRSTALVAKEFGDESNGWSLFGQFIVDYWYMFLLFGIFVWLLYKTYNIFKVKDTQPTLLQYIIFAPLVFVASVALFIGGVRGGFAHSTRPITISNATAYVNNLGEEAIVLNTPFSVLRTLKAEKLPRYAFFNNDEVEKIYSPLHNHTTIETNDYKFENSNLYVQNIDNTEPTDSLNIKNINNIEPSTNLDSVNNLTNVNNNNIKEFTHKNVVIFIVESLGKEYIGGYNKEAKINGYKSYTPFLDSLIDHSTIVRNSFATGKKSIDGMASVLASIPSLTAPFILTPYSNNSFGSIFTVLKEEGYNTSFFHGAPNGSMGMYAFSKKLGVDNYFGKAEYDAWRDGNDDFDGIWGIWDDKFFEFFSHQLNEISSQGKPFITSIFTLSSHHPFKVPTEYEGVFDKGSVDMHQVIGYTDMSLRNFFNRAKNESWFKNTIFVITGDHTNQSAYKEYSTTTGFYSVPLIFYNPENDGNPQVIESVGSQIDIFPSVLGLLNYTKPYFSFGFNLFNNSIVKAQNNFVVNYSGGTYNLYSGDYLLQYDGKTTKAIYRYRDDVFLQNNIMNSCTERNNLEIKIKAFLQQFNNRMLDDKIGSN